MFHALAMRLSSYGCTWVVGRELKRFFRALPTSGMHPHAKHDLFLILNYLKRELILVHYTDV